MAVSATRDSAILLLLLSSAASSSLSLTLSLPSAPLLCLSRVVVVLVMHSVVSPMSDSESSGWELDELWEEEARSIASLSPPYFNSKQSPVLAGSPSFPSLPGVSQRAVPATVSPMPSLATASIASSSSSARSVVSSVGPERVRVAHREIDARRRRKEANCISQLQGLLGLAPVEARLSVLQASVERIERLEAAVQELTAACKERDRKVQVLATHLQQLTSMMTASAQSPRTAQVEEESSTAVVVSPSSSVSSSSSSSSSSSFFPLSAGAVEYLRYLEEQRSLHSSYFSGSGVCMMLIDVTTQRMMDANATFFSMSGWTPAEILHRRCSVPAHELLATLSQEQGGEAKGNSRWFMDSEDNDRPMVRRRRADGSTALVPIPYLRQYPSTVRLLGEMLEGRITSYRGQWRCVWADSNAYESEMMAWVAKSEWVEEPDGRRWERPTQALVVAAPDSCIRLDIPAY